METITLHSNRRGSELSIALEEEEEVFNELAVISQIIIIRYLFDVESFANSPTLFNEFSKPYNAF